MSSPSKKKTIKKTEKEKRPVPGTEKSSSPSPTATVTPAFGRVFKIQGDSIFIRASDQVGHVADAKSEPLILHRQLLPAVFLGDCVDCAQAMLVVPQVRRRFCQVLVVTCHEHQATGKIEEKGSDLLVTLLYTEDVRLSAGQEYYAEVVTYPTPTQVAVLACAAPVTHTVADAVYETQLMCDQAHLSLGFPRPLLHGLKRMLAQHPEGDARYDTHCRDLTMLDFVTIDGETAQDFDDAVYAELADRGDYRLFVAIADVSRYVQEGSALDDEARRRGNSVYLPGRTLPMLPETLSDGLCSLKPDELRYTLVCEMHVGPRGAVKRYTFYPARIISAARLTYDQALALREAADDEDPLYERLQLLYDVYTVLSRMRQKRGAIDFDLPELRVHYGADGAFLGLRPLYRHDMHRVIEECMLAANVCAAQFLDKHYPHQPLYRVHESPDLEKIDIMRKVLSMHGLVVPEHFGGTVGDFAALLETMTAHKELQIFVLRSLKQAAYSDQTIGHFGLNYTHYTHFTSPIRRYADLLVHRMIKAIVCRMERTEDSLLNWRACLAHLSVTERIAEDVSRSLLAWYKCLAMCEHIGESFVGRISGVTHFGIFVSIADMNIEGVVHVSRLGQDYFYFDPKKMILCGRRHRKIYRVGDVLSVVVEHVNVRSRRIDLALIDSTYEKR